MNNLKKILLVIFILIASLFLTTTVKAASASISANKTTVNVGETVTISVNINAGGWEIHVSGAVKADYADSTSDGKNKNHTEQLTFTPSAEGDYTVNMTGNVADGDTDKTKDVSGSITITAKAAEQINNNSSNSSSNNSNNNSNNDSNSNDNTSKKSSNANLSNLGITPNDFSGFTPSKTSYSVSVPNDVTTVSIYANKGQSDQTISGTGSKTLQEGTNTFEVVVTAEDGTKKTYTLNITRETATENETENETANETANETTGEITQTGYTIGLKSLTISGVELSPSFSTGVYQYTAKLIGDRTTLDINAIALDENQKIEITGNEDLKEGENVITIIVTNAENTGSSENTTNTLNETTEETVNNIEIYQIIVNKSLVDEEAIARENAQKEQQKRTIIITILGVAIAIVVIILIVRYVRHRGEAEDFDGLYLPEEDNNYDDNFSNSNYSDNLGNEQQYDEDANKDFDLDQDNDGYEEHKSKRKGKRFK